MTMEQRNLDFLKDVVKKIWEVIRGAGLYAQDLSLSSSPPNMANCLKTSPSCMRKSFWKCIRICRASSAKRECFRNIRRSSSSASAMC